MGNNEQDELLATIQQQHMPRSKGGGSKLPAARPRTGSSKSQAHSQSRGKISASAAVTLEEQEKSLQKGEKKSSSLSSSSSAKAAAKEADQEKKPRWGDGSSKPLYEEAVKQSS